jgi:single-strand DNA-binding protein
MAGSVNKAIIIGRLGQDPDVRNTQSGDKIVNLSVATSDYWKDRSSGERKERTEWHRVVLFAKSAADFAANYLKNGSLVFVEGQLQTRKWSGLDGTDKYTTEIVVKPYNGSILSLDPSQGGANDYGGGRSF